MQLQPPFRFENGQITAEIRSAKALFTTRAGGVSQGRYGSLNLGLNTADSRENVLANRRLLADMIGCDHSSLQLSTQVHGTEIELALSSGVTKKQSADGFISDSRSFRPTVLVADCLPVLLITDGPVAALHCGWRGLAGGIIAKAVTQLSGLGSGPQSVTALIGPGIGGCCYEVSEDLQKIFSQYDTAHLPGSKLDLKQVAKQQLAENGVGQVYDLAMCTACSSPELFYSYRRDAGDTGRQAAVVWQS